jgi:CRP-like cAMP-binding protein
MTSYLEQFKILSPQEIAAFAALARPQTLQKGDFFAKEGQLSQSVAFVEEGIFRTYYLSSEGEEVTYCITFPQNLLTAYSSYITGQPTPENIQAITPARLLLVPKTEIERLSENSFNWQLLLRVLAEQEYLKLEKRIFLLQKEKSLLRYQDLLENHPEYVQQIPVQYLASYLGMTQRHLSRLRRELMTV